MASQSTKKKQKLFIEAYKRSGCNITAACEQAGISRQAYYDWLDKSDDFKTKRDNAEESLYDFVENALHKQIKDGNITAIIFYAKTKMKHRGYVEKQEFDHSTKDGTMKPTVIELIAPETGATDSEQGAD